MKRESAHSPWPAAGRRVAGVAGLILVAVMADPGPAFAAPWQQSQSTPVLRGASPGAPAQTVAPAQTASATASATGAAGTATGTAAAPTVAATATPPPPTPGVSTPAPSATPTPASTAAPTAPASLANEERPIIVVEDFDVDPDRPAAGSSFTLQLKVANRGEHFAENISLALSGDAFLPTDRGANLFWNSLDEGEDDQREVRLRAASGLAAGVYRLGIALRWDDSYGGSYTDSTSIGIEVSSGAARPVVAVIGSRLPGRVMPGSPFTLALDLVNSGGREARNIVAVPLAGPLALVGAGGSPPLHLAPGAGATLVLQLMASQPSQPGAATQTLELRYDSPDGERYTDTQALGVLVAGDMAAGPMPLIAGYETRPAGETGSRGDGAAGGVTDLHPGQVFELALDLVNVGAGAAEGLRLVLGGTGAGVADLRPFAPVGTSNVRYLDRLAPGERRTVTQSMVVDGDAEPGVYPINVGFAYTDAKGEARESGEVISLLVARRVNLTLNPIEVVTSTVMGRSVRFSLELVNAGTGRVNVGNVEVIGSRYVAVADGTRYVGALDAGSVDVIDATLEPRAPGSATVTVAVHYLDDFAREQTLRQDFELLVEESPPPEVTPEEAPQGNLVVRILKGLLGLGASPPSPASPSPSSSQAPAAEVSPTK